MTLSEHTERLPGSNKVRYPISGRNDFTMYFYGLWWAGKIIPMKNVLSALYRILSFKRPGRLHIFFDFGVGVYWRGVLNREGR